VCSIKPQDQLHEISSLLQLLNQGVTNDSKKAKQILSAWGMSIKSQPIQSQIKTFPKRPVLSGPFDTSLVRVSN